MKAFLLLPALLLSPVSIVSPEGSKPIPKIATSIIVEHNVDLINGKIDSREELIEAMAFVESGGNPDNRISRGS